MAFFEWIKMGSNAPCGITAPPGQQRSSAVALLKQRSLKKLRLIRQEGVEKAATYYREICSECLVATALPEEKLELYKEITPDQTKAAALRSDVRLSRVTRAKSIEMSNIPRRCGSVRGQRFTGIETGTVHALMAKGAGKSTLMKNTCRRFTTGQREIRKNGKSLSIRSKHHWIWAFHCVRLSLLRTCPCRNIFGGTDTLFGTN